MFNVLFGFTVVAWTIMIVSVAIPVIAEYETWEDLVCAVKEVFEKEEILD
jgi:hypothetical protein